MAKLKEVKKKAASRKKEIKKPKKRVASSSLEAIVIDETKGLVFKNEDELFKHFKPQIDILESEYMSLRTDADLSDKQVQALGHLLDETLDYPDAVWMDNETFSDLTVFHFVREFSESEPKTYYVTTAYLSQENVPTFVLLHFATQDRELVENFKRGEQVYDKLFEVVEPAALDGDAIYEGDPLAIGLCAAMLKIRSEKDISIDNFRKYGDLREDTINSPDEIWRNSDLSGHVLVSFVKEYHDHEDIKDLYYVVVTQEDESSTVHSLLFSFPTTDESLVERYRHGENLQAEEVVQESSH